MATKSKSKKKESNRPKPLTSKVGLSRDGKRRYCKGGKLKK